jgi:hypothetical protein
MLFSLWSTAIADEAAIAAAAHLQRNEQGRYDLEARQQPLEAVLRALAELEDFELIAKDLPPKPVTRGYRDITADRLIDRLTAGLIVATQYHGKGSSRRLEKVVVYANTGGGAPSVSVSRVGNATASDEVDRISAALRGDYGLEQARRGMEQLAQANTPESALLLAEALESDKVEIRREAMANLAKMKDETAVQVLGQVLFGHEDPEERLLAAELLQRSANPEAKALLAAASDDSDPRIQSLAAAAAAQSE